MVYSCYVCKQEYYPDCGLSFHGFPRDPIRRALWVNALPHRTRRVTHTAMVCSRHFKREDYEMKQWKRVLKKDAVPSVRLTNKRNNLGENPDSAIFFGTLSIPAQKDQNQAPKFPIGTPLRLSKNDNDEVTIACNSDNDSETQDVEYLDIEESGSYKPSESSSEEDRNDVPRTENNKLLKSVKKDIKNNVTSDENMNIENEALTRVVAKMNKIADELSRKKDDEFDGFGKYIATTLRSLPAKMAIIATKEIHETVTDVQLKSIAQQQRKMDKH